MAARGMYDPVVLSRTYAPMKNTPPSQGSSNSSLCHLPSFPLIVWRAYFVHQTQVWGMGKGSRQIPSLMALIPASSPPSPPSLSPLPQADPRSPSSSPIFPQRPQVCFSIQRKALPSS